MTDGGRQRVRPQAAGTRAPLTSYYRGSAKQNKTSPFQKKEKAKPFSARIIKAVDILIILMLVFCMIYSLIVNPDPKIITNSNLYQPNYIYQAAVASQINQLKDRTKLTFDEASLIASMQRQFPEISNADIELPLFGQKPIVRLAISQPKFILKAVSGNYVVSDSGTVVSKDLKLPGVSNLPVVTDQSGFTTQLGKVVLSPAQVSFINTVVSQCKRAGVNIKSMVLPARSQELDLRTKDKKYFVKFYLSGDALVQSGQFLAARNHFQRDGKDPSQYLDVRIQGKVFYK